MTKALCITLNTAIDLIIEIDRLTPGSTIRATGAITAPAGKGIDIAIGVATLGGNAIASGFIGDQSREVFRELSSQVKLLLLEVPGATRTNVTIVEGGLRETHLQTTGYSISREHVEQLVESIAENLQSGDIAVIAGSIPGGASEKLTSRLIHLCKAKGAYVVLDSSGAALEDGIGAQPDMIKPNLQELGQLMGYTIADNDTTVVLAAKECVSRGIERVVVSRGRNGIVSVDKQNAYKAWVDVGRRETTAGVGSGDSTVAGLVFAHLEGLCMADSMRLAVACGAANLFAKLPGRFTKETVKAILPTVQLASIPKA